MPVHLVLGCGYNGAVRQSSEMCFCATKTGRCRGSSRQGEPKSFPVASPPPFVRSVDPCLS